MTKYPNIHRAALQIALDNGGINRFRSVKKQSKEFERWVSTQPEEMLDSIEIWFSTLSEDQMYDVCCGGEGEPEREELMKNAPPFTDVVLDSYFEEVC